MRASPANPTKKRVNTTRRQRKICRQAQIPSATFILTCGSRPRRATTSSERRERRINVASICIRLATGVHLRLCLAVLLLRSIDCGAIFAKFARRYLLILFTSFFFFTLILCNIILSIGRRQRVHDVGGGSLAGQSPALWLRLRVGRFQSRLLGSFHPRRNLAQHIVVQLDSCSQIP